MANNIIIRKAKQDYVCDCCGHIIRAGSEYLDKVILNNGKCVQHDRYHDECPKQNKIIKALIENTSAVPVVHDGTKYWLVGVMYNDTGLAAMIMDWDKEDTLCVSEKEFLEEWRIYD